MFLCFWSIIICIICECRRKSIINIISFPFVSRSSIARMEQSASCYQRHAVTAVFPSAFKDIFVSIVIRLLTVSPVLSQRFSRRWQCPCNKFIKRHFNQYFINNNNNNNQATLPVIKNESETSYTDIPYSKYYIIFTSLPWRHSNSDDWRITDIRTVLCYIVYLNSARSSIRTFLQRARSFRFMLLDLVFFLLAGHAGEAGIVLAVSVPACACVSAHKQKT